MPRLSVINKPIVSHTNINITKSTRLEPNTNRASVEKDIKTGG